MKWGAFAGVLTFILLMPLAIMNQDQTTAISIIGMIAAIAGILVTLIGKWWEREWNSKIAEAELRRSRVEEAKLRLEERRVSIEEARLNIELIRLNVELIAAIGSLIGSLSSLIGALPEKRRSEVAERLVELAMGQINRILSRWEKQVVS